MTENENNGTILVVEDSLEMNDHLDSLLSGEGYTTIRAPKEDGVEKAENAVPDIVLVDLRMPDLDGLELCKKLKQNSKTQDAAVIIMSTITDTEIKAKGLNVGAVDFIQQSVGDVELLARIQAQLRLKREVDKLRRKYSDICEKLQQTLDVGNEVIDQRSIRRESKLLVCASDASDIQGLVNQLLFGISKRLKAKTRNDLALGLHEMILNAIEHGNFGITSEEKAEALANNNYNALIEERAADPELGSRKVEIDYEFDGSKISYRIKDEGKGFDWKTRLSQEEPEDLLASNGRGILISRYIFTRIAYNDQGNEVTLEKDLRE
jgi:CheY-like chemotaxis protein/anti-sigma regulatory factor (Ser/Thr protein kinase)